MFKRWLAILGAVVLIVCTFQLLWGGGGNEGDEYPWGNATGGGGTGSTGGTGSAAVNSRTGSPLRQIFIVRPAPMGGFYLIRINLPSGVSAKTDAGVKRVQD